MIEHRQCGNHPTSRPITNARYLENKRVDQAIGSDFESTATATATDNGSNGIENESLPWALTGTALEYVQTGRQALAAIAAYLYERDFDKIIFPGHYCESMISPFIDVGFEIVSVPVKDSIRMDLGKTWDEAHKFLGRTAVFGMLYFGELPDKEYSDFVRSLSNSGIPYVEDETHRLFQPGGVDADFTVGSLRKLLPVADGAYLRHKKQNNVVAEITDNQSAELRWLAMDAKAKNDTDFLEKMTKANEALELGHGAASMSERSLATINSLNYQKLASQRTSNAKVLYSLLNDLGIPTLERDWGQITPSHLVIKTIDAAQLQRQLAQYQVYCPIHWAAPNQQPRQSKWKDGLLSIPVDHRYGDSDMERIVNVLRKEWKK